ncbi:hypothetical protein JYK04_04244 [Streptomyces nojiriensis]|nr:hypothetical protein JYK04_04244 [Streptomyces nojiriensis]
MNRVRSEPLTVLVFVRCTDGRHRSPTYAHSV